MTFEELDLEDDVLDGHDQEKQPNNARNNTHNVAISQRHRAITHRKHRAHDVERTRADIPEHNAEGTKTE